jgi:UDP-N-acetylmuramate--alanine ligase
MAVVPRAHLVGIAGSGMSALADVLRQAGWIVSGSDLNRAASHSRPTPRAGVGCGNESSTQARPLQWAGTPALAGHAAANVSPELDLLIYSAAIPAENVERRRAAELQIPAISYAQMLGRLMVDKRGLAVAGTHGKSTAAAMAAHVLVAAGLDPTVVVGATPLGATSGGRCGRGDLVLVEACEYRGNFLHLQPQYAAILGIEPDHFDCYASPEQLEGAFARFAALVPKDGYLLLREDCPTTRRAAAGTSCRVETFGLGPEADWSARELTARVGRYRFQICHRAEPLGEVRLRVAGRHNVLNALAAAALSRAAGAEPAAIVAGLSSFAGLHRRLEVLGSAGGIAVVDDYAHHPTEVAAALESVRQMFPGRRLWCVFQPHQASRTERLLGELAASLQNADTVVVADIFRAREGPPRAGDVTAADLAREVRAHGVETLDVHMSEEITGLLQTHLHAGDVLVTMGAGDIGRMAHGFVERFREDRAAG